MLGALKGSKSTPQLPSAETPAELAHRHALLLAVDMRALDADAADARTALGVAKGQVAVLDGELELLKADEPARAPIGTKPAKGKPAESTSELPPFRPTDDEPELRALVVDFQKLVAGLAREVAAIRAAGARAEVLRNADRLEEQSAMNTTLHKRVLERTMRQLSRNQGPDVLVIGDDAVRGGSRGTSQKGQQPSPDPRRGRLGLTHSRSLPEIRALRKPARLERSPAAAHAPLKSHWDSAAVPRCITRTGLSASFLGNLRPAKWVSAGVGTDPAKLFEWQPEPEPESPSRRLRAMPSAEALGHAACGRDASPLANRSRDSLSPLGLHASRSRAPNSFATGSAQESAEQTLTAGQRPAARARRTMLASSQSLPEIRRRTRS